MSHISKRTFISLLLSISVITAVAQKEIPKLDNPMSVEYLKKNLRKSQPRLVFNSKIERNLKKKMKTDPVLQNMYKAIQLNAKSIFNKPLLTRTLVGRRLLGTSREMLWRINMLGFIYRMEKDPKVLQRINEEVIAVCNFKDWNPSHYLDVGEMSMAVAFALDWTAGALPKSTQQLAIISLIEKGIKPSWPVSGKNPWWAYGNNNWNQVCNGGMIAAAITIAEENPELAAKTIHRALEGIPHSLAEYGPDGVYPEGSTYWGYGTSFSVVSAAMLESSFGHDFGHATYPAFLESAVFRVLSVAPSGWYYNFADCGSKRGNNGDITLAWFAAKTGNETFFEKERFLRPPEEIGKLSRLAGAGMSWLSQYEATEHDKMPSFFKGDGSNPIVIITGGENDPHNYYFGGKGGYGKVNHGNMDAGSFVFELNDVRWVIDPGNQGYNDLEKTGFDLWNSSQDGERWTLLTKNNFGHSTITVNNEMHRVDGFSPLVSFENGDKPEAVFNLSKSLGDLVSKATRRFIKDSKLSLIIEDEITISEKTELITWQLMTTADVEIVEGGAILKQHRKELKIENLSHPDLNISVVSLYPAPMELDIQIEGLKRLEIRIPAWTIEDRVIRLRVRLSGE